MNGTALITGIWKNFRNRLKHSEVFVSDDQAYTFQSSFLKPYKERTPALLVFFHAFSGADNLTASIVADTNGNKDRYVLDLTTPAAFQIDAVNIDIRIAVGQWACTPGFDMLICLFIEVADSAWGYLFPTGLR